MVSAKVVINNPSGLHLRPAGKLCDTAAYFEDCQITFRFDNYSANAKSVLSVLGACVKQGDEVEFICNGPSEKEALARILKLVENELEAEEKKREAAD